MNRVRTRIIGSLKNFFRFDHFDHLRFSWIRLCVDDMHARRAQPRHHQITPLDMRMWRIRTKCRTASIPTEMVQLIAKLRQGHLANALPVSRGPGIEIHNYYRVVKLTTGRVERRDKCMLLGRGLHRQSRRWVKCRVRFQERHKFPSVCGSIHYDFANLRSHFTLISSCRQGQFNLNFIQAKWLGARPDISCARNFASRRPWRVCAFLKMKMRVRQKAARRSVSWVREK